MAAGADWFIHMQLPIRDIFLINRMSSRTCASNGQYKKHKKKFALPEVTVYIMTEKKSKANYLI